MSAPATVVTPPARDVEPARPPQDRRRGWVRGGLLALALVYLSALLLLPLVGIVWTALSPGWSTVKETFTRADVLHAFQLTFSHPTDGRSMTFEAPLPEDLRDVLGALRRASGKTS